MAISSPLRTAKVKSQSVPLSNNSIKNIQENLIKQTKVKKEILDRKSKLQDQRRENERRQQLEDQLEAPNLVITPSGPIQMIQNSTKGFLERILGFLGYLTAGWLMNNLATWIAMGKEFIGRVQRLGQIITGLLDNTKNIFIGFGNLLSAAFQNLIQFDLFDTSNRVNSAFENLNGSINDMGKELEEAIQLITSPLSEGITTGENAPPTGSKITDEGAYEPGEPYSGSGSGSVGGIHKQALDIIAGPESGGNYNAMNQGTDKNGNIVGSTMGGKTSKDIIGKNLTDMTIGEVIDRQNQSKYPRGGKNDKGIHAAGKYQMIGNTLPGAMKSAGLSEKDLFSPENQDKMGLALLKERGIQPWTSGGSKYSAKEMQIVEQARKTPVSTSVPPSQISQTSSGKGGKVVEYITGDRTHKRYAADHGGGNYHDHVAFDSQKTRDAAIKWMRSRGWTIGSINTGKHADGSYHYSNQAFDIPFYDGGNYKKKGATDDTKGETKFSSLVRADLIAGGFSGPQLGGSSTPSPSQPEPQIGSVNSQGKIYVDSKYGYQSRATVIAKGLLPSQDIKPQPSTPQQNLVNPPGALAPGQRPDRALTSEQLKIAQQTREQGKASGLTGEALEKSVAAAVMASSSTTQQTPAQISQSSTQAQQNQQLSQQITPDRRGQTIIFQQPSQSQSLSYSTGGGSGMVPISVNEIALVNNFMKKKLLLDLAYL